MNAILHLVLAASSTFSSQTPNSEPVKPEEPFVWELDTVSNNCEARLEGSVDKKGGYSLVFIDSDLHVDANKKVDLFSCKVSWNPLIPAHKRLRSAVLSVSGEYVTGGRSKALLRLGHRLLGTGSSPSAESIDLDEGPFEHKIELQNLEDDNCGKETKLISAFSLLLTRDKVWSSNAEQPLPVLKLKQVYLSGVSWEDCPSEEGSTPIKSDHDMLTPVSTDFSREP